MFLIYDTETTGLPKNWKAPLSDSDNWPRMVQIAWQLHDAKGDLVEVKNFIVKPEGYNIPFTAQKIHGISTERATKQGVELSFVLEEFNKALAKTEFVVGHNIEFDINIAGAEFLRKGIESPITGMKTIDTKNESTNFCAIPGGKGGRFKWPTLTELYVKLFNNKFDEAHNASADVEATARCFLELIRLDVINGKRLGKDDAFIKSFRQNNSDTIQLIGLNIEPYSRHDMESTAVEMEAAIEVDSETATPEIEISSTDFVHLHVHSQFSILQAVGQPAVYVDKAVEYEMKAIAMTDRGNMMGAFAFVGAANKKGVKPIVGSEIHICKNHEDKSYKDNGYLHVILAKNKKGYHNLAKLSSISFTSGFYYVPRIDKEVLLKYKDDLIVTTGGLFSEIPSLILNVGEQQAEEAFCWWHEHFGDDFYVEINRHQIEEEDVVNETLLRFAKKYNVKYFASNDAFYPNQDDAEAHDLLLCVKDNELADKPKRFIGSKGREYRFGYPNNEWYFKSSSQMAELFKDIPEALECTIEIADKCEGYELARDVLLPKFDIPEEFVQPEDETDGGKRGENAFLRHITYQGAEKRYGEINDELRTRIDFELDTIANTGYPGYFLIVQDFTSEARKIGVSVGPGRGSAAGSVVAYCIGITNVDPIKYDLLFERFLNPERVSMPDIDIDFDDEGRGKVIDYVIRKYGSNQVAQIVTYGTMAAKSSIRDTARVLDLPLSDAGKIANLIPVFTTLDAIFTGDDKKLKDKLRTEDYERVEQLRKLSDTGDDLSKTIQQARALEGSLRNTGVHACGVIITPSDITNHIPVAKAKDSDLVVTQFDNSVVESAGLLKMDFLGLKTLSIIKDAIEIAEIRNNIKIDPDNIPLDDEKTYELFQRGDTKGLFQFESAGMRKYLMELKPDKFEDLIAMNALYRPGPLEYIPNFIARKHGKEPITYDLDAMEELLDETYGITVYQEQVMLLSQKLAGFSKGEADSLRKAMGKKKKEIIDKLKPKFIEGCKANGHDPEKADKVWKDWEAFAAYAFNKSHSTCYSVIAFHTAYLKAHYPAAYMASVLTHNLSDIKKVTEFMEESKRINIPVLGPDINESGLKFTVNAKGAIRFGLAAMKGIGESAVRSLIEEREENGEFLSVFDFVQRIDSRAVNKRSIEALVLGGAFDSMGIERERFFAFDAHNRPFIETLVKYGNRYREAVNSPQASLFGGESEVSLPEPIVPPADTWPIIEKFKKEKEVVGIYISGHPLDQYKVDLESFCNIDIQALETDQQRLIGRDLYFGGMVTDFNHRQTKDGRPWGDLTIEDYSGSTTLRFFKQEYVKFKDYFMLDNYVFVQVKLVANQWQGNDTIRTNVQKMSYLDEVRLQMGKWLKLEIDMRGFGNGMLEKLEQTLRKHKGKSKVKMTFIDASGKLKVDSVSKDILVNPENALLDELKAIPFVDFAISRKG